MESHLPDVTVRWTPDLAVGSAPMDARNRAMFGDLAAAARCEDTLPADALAAWLAGLFDRLEQLLDAEERELADAGYRELAFHRQVHARLRDKLRLARLLADKAPDAAALAAHARETCAALAVWLMRHVQDEDRLFLPYVDGSRSGGSP